MKKIKKSSLTYLRLMHVLENCIQPIWNYLKHGYKVRSLKQHGLYLATQMLRHLEALGSKLNNESEFLGELEGPRLHKLYQVTQGLHALLPTTAIDYSYTILIAVMPHVTIAQLKRSLQAALKQTAPKLEILVGCSNSITPAQENFLLQFQKSHSAFQIKKFTEKTEQAIFNQLAQVATGAFLLPLGATDWIRPDFLFRCEQLLRLLPASKPVCLYTDEWQISKHNYHTPGQIWQKTKRLAFPYIFKDEVGCSLLIPRQEWLAAQGLQLNPSAFGWWDLALRLDQLGVTFQHIPFGLYAHHARHTPSLAERKIFLEHLATYTKAKGLNWEWQIGEIAQTFRAQPLLVEQPTVQVIIPFKNQKELTLKTVQSVLQQTGIKFFITAVDNGSEDLSIAAAIRERGGEVIEVQEPFNYSRLNNLAVERTQTAQACEYVLFLNNDVELEPQSLAEMCRWAAQPAIGLVGCHLSYPNGTLQHGGVDLKQELSAQQLIWVHSEKLYPPQKQYLAKLLRVSDAVTAACALMKRKLFIEVKGFDESYYPIAFSDTNLALKLRAFGFYSLYTPYARGIHHESISRQHKNIEDIESSRWMHQQVMKQQLAKLTGILEEEHASASLFL